MAQHSTSTLPRFSVLILLIVGLVYSNALFNGFVYDDWDLVVRNPWVHEGRLIDAFQSGYWESSRGGSFYYRPIASVTYRVDYALFGAKPFGYHLRNIALHALSSILVLLLAARWTGSNPAAAAAAALFAVHPIHAQSVTWIAGRTDLLATCFCLGALLLMQAGADSMARNRPAGSGRKRLPGPVAQPGGSDAPPASERPAPLAMRFGALTFILAGLLAAALALLSKEMAATFPALLLLHIFIMRRTADAPRSSVWAIPMAASILLVAGWLVLRTTILGAPIGFADDPHSWWHPADGTSARLLAVPLIVSFYLRRLLFPLSLGFESGIQPLHDAADPALWSAAAGMALLAGLAWRFRRRQPPVTFGILWLMLSLLPVLNILPVFEAAMEHFAYLPSVGFAIAAVAVGREIVKKPEARVALCVGLIVLLGVRTMVRNGDWRDEETFWRITVRDTPSGRAWYKLGIHFEGLGRPDEAREAFEAAIRLAPALAEPHLFLADLLWTGGQRERAADLYRRYLELAPGGEGAPIARSRATP